eukprot:8521314-Alexandrium_andersonii.AAC.1
MHQASFYAAQTGGRRLARAVRSGVNVRRVGEERALDGLWGAPEEPEDDDSPDIELEGRWSHPGH